MTLEDRDRIATAVTAHLAAVVGYIQEMTDAPKERVKLAREAGRALVAFVNDVRAGSEKI